MSTKVELPTLQGDLIANLVSMNLSGKFKGQEIKELSQSFIEYLVNSKKINIVFGQQCGFRMSQIPKNCEFVGNQRALIIYNKKFTQANDETQYRHFLRDLEMRGRLARFYLPETNYALCKMKSKMIHDVSFLAMSWMTDETKDTLLCLNLLRKVLSFTANLCAIEEMPVIIGGTFRLTLDEIKSVVYNEFEGFRCYGYKTTKSRRQARMCDVFISCPPLKLDEVKPIVCTKIDGRLNKNHAMSKWFNPEEAFYWDPVFAKMNLRSGTSIVSSPSSPRAISPFFMENMDCKGDVIISECPYSLNKRETFDSAEHTLKLLLAESERIKELVNEAEVKSRQILNNSQSANQQNGDLVEATKQNALESKPLVKVPSYVDLYDEELIETNKFCYLQ
ncbi:hypothetical protein HELRODRAFT_162389 [Helobdella robusta]|uniref:Uncharacterized protein n=1 Tax=Helobdella robusta TaxID=6412 RepID=T1ESL3_HELRO|nr:hypothetical protein HELRODRAFT_162389 [Helobdella robusta]ESN98920.1 hypothetical protein HELRODRAFT_162389 [Helobdella robusta]